MKPTPGGDWINHRNEAFESYCPLTDKTASDTIFFSSGAGLQTNRDAWVYNYSQRKVVENIELTARYFNAAVDSNLIDPDPTHVSWTSGLEQRFSAKSKLEGPFTVTGTAVYRPFSKTRVSRYVDLVHRPASLRRFFPTVETSNHGFYIVGGGNDKPFSVLAVDQIPDLSFWGSGQGQFFPRYSFTVADNASLFDDPADSSGLLRLDNVTDSALSNYQSTYSPNVTKDDIFYYTYGILHSPDYRTRFAPDLKKMLPRIPQVPGADRFRSFVEAGKALAELHIGYESLDPYALNEVSTGLAFEKDEYARYATTKMKYAGKAGAWDKTRIIYNTQVTLEGIPHDAHRYLLGSRSAVDWILERYQVKTDKASGIVNDPNDWSREHGQPRYIIDLIGRIVTLSLKTNQIVDSLPQLALD